MTTFRFPEIAAGFCAATTGICTACRGGTNTDCAITASCRSGAAAEAAAVESVQINENKQ